MHITSKKKASHLKEKDFLIKFAVDCYNAKFGNRVKAEYCRIKSVRSAYGYQYGYQIETVRSDDQVVIMLYFNLGDQTREHIVRMEAKKNIIVDRGTGDEVYVVTGEIARYYKDEGIYRFLPIGGGDFGFTSVMYMDQDIFSFMDGDYFSFMSPDPAPPFP